MEESLGLFLFFFAETADNRAALQLNSATVIRRVQQSCCLSPTSTRFSNQFLVKIFCLRVQFHPKSVLAMLRTSCWRICSNSVAFSSWRQELGHKHNLGHPVVVSLYLDLFLGGGGTQPVSSPQPVIFLLSVFTLTTEAPLYHQTSLLGRWRPPCTRRPPQ